MTKKTKKTYTKTAQPAKVKPVRTNWKKKYDDLCAIYVETEEKLLTVKNELREQIEFNAAFKQPRFDKLADDLQNGEPVMAISVREYEELQKIKERLRHVLYLNRVQKQSFDVLVVLNLITPTQVTHANGLAETIIHPLTAEEFEKELNPRRWKEALSGVEHGILEYLRHPSAALFGSIAGGHLKHEGLPFKMDDTGAFKEAKR